MISTIILDLGGVILNLDQNKTFEEFTRIGLGQEEMSEHEKMFHDFEKGLINDSTFRNNIRSILKKEITDNQIDFAWNAMLLDLPEERLSLIKQLQNKYEVYLLSNTNSIHISAFDLYFNSVFENENWNAFFNKIYYSHQINLRKPDTSIYEFVLNDIGKKPGECIFIDDNESNIAGADKCGIRTILATQPLSEITMAQINFFHSNLQRLNS
ncbi:MAG: HAD family phosphatase [Bacteroidota bacterium]